MGSGGAKDEDLPIFLGESWRGTMALNGGYFKVISHWAASCEEERDSKLH